MDITANRPSSTARRFEAGTPAVVNCYAAEAGLKIISRWARHHRGARPVSHPFVHGPAGGDRLAEYHATAGGAARADDLYQGKPGSAALGKLTQQDIVTSSVTTTCARRFTSTTANRTWMR